MCFSAYIYEFEMPAWWLLAWPQSDFASWMDLDVAPDLMGFPRV